MLMPFKSDPGEAPREVARKVASIEKDLDLNPESRV
jgi:hypothetical protein